MVWQTFPKKEIFVSVCPNYQITLLKESVRTKIVT